MYALPKHPYAAKMCFPIFLTKGCFFFTAPKDFCFLTPTVLAPKQVSCFFVILESAKKKYGHLPGEIHVIQLSKGTGGVGLSLAGNKDR